jgi:hypothetical protein
MDSKGLVHLLAGFVLLISTPCPSQESLVTYKSLAPGIALELAQAALANCQQRGYQVAIAVVDRFGVIAGAVLRLPLDRVPFARSRPIFGNSRTQGTFDCASQIRAD